MLKCTKGFITEILQEKRSNLATRQSIYSCDTKKLMPEVAKELIQDIDDFQEKINGMFSKGDVYIEILNNSDNPVNETETKVEVLKLICYVKAQVGVNITKNQRLYWVVAAVQAEDTGLTDLYNREIYKDPEGRLFCVETQENPMDKGSILFTKAKFRDN